MSLKAFHVVFITAAVLLCLGVGVWLLREFRSPEGGSGDLWMGVGFLATAVGLVFYEVRFLKKTKNISYL